MHRSRTGFFPRFACALFALAFFGLEAYAARAPDSVPPSGGAELRARFDAMRESLRGNAFGRPLRLESREAHHRVEGEVYALVDHPFAEVEQALHEASQWCEVLVLPFNVKRCVATEGRAGSHLALFIARRKDSTPDDSYRLDFRFREEARDAGFLRIALSAPSGPFGTHDYRIVLEAAPAGAARAILHLAYSYGYGVISELAMQAFLSTAGAGNVGFTVRSRDAEGKPVYVRGMRGVMERNTMRYFLAIEAYLASLSVPAASREDARLRAWFEAADRYPRQLHEMPLDRYLAMKQRDLRWREAAGGSAPGG